MRIAKGETNEIIVTLTEKQTIENAYFLFWFKNELQNREVACILTDTSQFPNRYNMFSLEEGEAGDVELDEGTNTYKIYAQTSAVNLDPDSADELVEEGICIVYTDPNTRPEHEPELDYIAHDPT